MVKVREALPEEIPFFAEVESTEDVVEFILPYDLERHYSEFHKQNTVYLSVLDEEELIGFIILVQEPDGISVEFRRIVISAKGRGHGQSAIAAMEDYCRKKLNRKRIWLDVFEFNKRGQHIYEKFGYTRFREGQHDGKRLLFYEKTFQNDYA